MKKRTGIDILILCGSVIIAFVLAKYHVFEIILKDTSYFGGVIESFVAGMFFTSIFTTSPAIVALGEISQTNNIFLVAFIGGFGAMIGDFLIFKFFKDRIGDDLISFLKTEKRGRFKKIFRSAIGKRIMAIIGGLIIASPLPDELGLALLGLSKIKNYLFFPLSFIFNFLGILIIGLIANF